MTRKEKLEQIANQLTAPHLRNMISRSEAYKYCVEAAEWADANPVKDFKDEIMVHQKMKIDALQAALEAAEKALNKIGILQMGGLDYTQDFFEITKATVREALVEIFSFRGDR